MVDALWQHNHVALAAVNADPLVIVVPHIEIAWMMLQNEVKSEQQIKVGVCWRNRPLKSSNTLGQARSTLNIFFGWRRRQQVRCCKPLPVWKANRHLS